MRLDGYNLREMAAGTGIYVCTIRRKLRRVRELWMVWDLAPRWAAVVQITGRESLFDPRSD